MRSLQQLFPPVFKNLLSIYLEVKCNKAIDENVRHSISKFSVGHFVSNKNIKKGYTTREDPRNIFCVGSTSIENIKEINKII